jgi:hypothetical protein
MAPSAHSAKSRKGSRIEAKSTLRNARADPDRDAVGGAYRRLHNEHRIVRGKLPLRWGKNEHHKSIMGEF